MKEITNDELPDGWASIRIGELVDLAPKNSHPDELKVGFVPMPLMGQKYCEPIRFEVRAWSEVKKGYTHFKDGDVLLAKITPCFENGKGGIAHNLPNGVGAGSTEYFVCRPHLNRIVPEILHAFFKTSEFMTNGETNMSGSVGHKRVPKDFLLNTQIPLAPLPEQKRIADKLESVLGRVDACRARLDRVPALLKRFRQSVLSAAVSGQLTESWRESFPGAKESNADSSRFLNERYSIPEEWEEKTLSELSTMVTSGSRGWADYYSSTGAVFIRAQNINADRLDLEDVAHVLLPDKAEGKRAVVKRNDLLITITGANVGKSARVKIDLEEAYISQHIALVKLRDSKQAAFVELFLWAENAGRGQLNEAAYGGGKPGLNLQNIRELIIGLPSLHEQQEIVRRVAALFAIADRIEARLATAQKTIDRLTPATLAKAFRGQLVPQDPNDEPAINLLQRLRDYPKPDSKPRRRKIVK